MRVEKIKDIKSFDDDIGSQRIYCIVHSLLVASSLLSKIESSSLRSNEAAATTGFSVGSLKPIDLRCCGCCCCGSRDFCCNLLAGAVVVAAGKSIWLVDGVALGDAFL